MDDMCDVQTRITHWRSVLHNTLNMFSHIQQDTFVRDFPESNTTGGLFFFIVNFFKKNKGSTKSCNYNYNYNYCS